MRISKESNVVGPRDDGSKVPGAGQSTKPTVEKRSYLSRVIPKLFSSSRRSKTKATGLLPITRIPTSSSSSLKSTPSSLSNSSTSSSSYEEPASAASVAVSAVSNVTATSLNNNISMARAAPDLTEETMKEFREAFALFDLNGDGMISAEELGVFISKMGTTTSTQADLNRMIAEVDADGDGAIDFPEFVTLMARKMNNVDKDTEIREAFNVYDKDGSGKISSKELLNLMSKFHKDVSKTDIEQMIKEADTNGDGEIEFEEFKRMLS